MHNMSKVQKMRQSVFNLFRNAEEKATKSASAPALLSDNMLLSLRIDKVEQQVDRLNKSLDNKFFAISSQLSEVKNLLRGQEASDHVPAPKDQEPRGISSYSAHIATSHATSPVTSQQDIKTSQQNDTVPRPQYAVLGKKPTLTPLPRGGVALVLESALAADTAAPA